MTDRTRRSRSHRGAQVVGRVRSSRGLEPGRCALVAIHRIGYLVGRDGCRCPRIGELGGQPFELRVPVSAVCTRSLEIALARHELGGRAERVGQPLQPPRGMAGVLERPNERLEARGVVGELIPGASKLAAL
jgi:hypothetical protein